MNNPDTLCTCGHPFKIHNSLGCLHGYIAPETTPTCPCAGYAGPYSAAESDEKTGQFLGSVLGIDLKNRHAKLAAKAQARALPVVEKLIAAGMTEEQIVGIIDLVKLAIETREASGGLGSGLF